MRLLMVVREDTVFLQHRLPIAVAARRTGYDVHVFSVDTGKLDCIRGMGFSTHELPQKVYWLPFWGALKNVVHYIAAFRRLKPDIIHLSSTYVCLLGGFAALFVRRSRVWFILYWIGLHIFGKAANLEVCSDFVEADHRLHMESTKHLSTFSEYG